MADNGTQIKKCFAKWLRRSDQLIIWAKTSVKNQKKKKKIPANYTWKFTLGNWRPGHNTQLCYAEATQQTNLSAVICKMSMRLTCDSSKGHQAKLSPNLQMRRLRLKGLNGFPRTRSWWVAEPRCTWLRGLSSCQATCSYCYMRFNTDYLNSAHYPPILQHPV